jgi:hypothetical protein
MSLNSDRKQRSISFQQDKRLYYVTFYFNSELHQKYARVNAFNLDEAYMTARIKFGGIVASVYTAKEWESRHIAARGFTELGKE